MLEEEKVEELRREMLELRQQLDKERSARMHLEEQVSCGLRLGDVFRLSVDRLNNQQRRKTAVVPRHHQLDR